MTFGEWPLLTKHMKGGPRYFLHHGRTSGCIRTCGGTAWARRHPALAVCSARERHVLALCIPTSPAGNGGTAVLQEHPSCWPFAAALGAASSHPVSLSPLAGRPLPRPQERVKLVSPDFGHTPRSSGAGGSLTSSLVLHILAVASEQWRKAGLRSARELGYNWIHMVPASRRRPGWLSRTGSKSLLQE